MLAKGTKITFKNNIICNGAVILNRTYFVDESNDNHTVIVTDGNYDEICFEGDFLQKMLENINADDFEVIYNDDTIETLNNIRVNRMKNNITPHFNINIKMQ